MIDRLIAAIHCESMSHLRFLCANAVQLRLLLFALSVREFEYSIAIFHFELGNLLLELRAVLVQLLVLTLHRVERLGDGLSLQRRFSDCCVSASLFCLQLNNANCYCQFGCPCRTSSIFFIITARSRSHWCCC